MPTHCVTASAQVTVLQITQPVPSVECCHTYRQLQQSTGLSENDIRLL